MKVMITGFDPFGGEKINPAWEGVRRVENLDNITLVKVEIPTVFKKSIEVLRENIIKENPDIILCVGQAGGISDIRIERIGINIDDARIADNMGNQPIDEVIFKDGENAYFSNIPIKLIVDELKKEGIPASVSNSAGTFVCNHILYGLMYLIDKEFNNIRGGFIHVPFIPSQVVDRPKHSSMSLENISRAIEVAIKTSVKYRDDEKLIGGSIY